jgi:hypothetical protein
MEKSKLFSIKNEKLLQRVKESCGLKPMKEANFKVEALTPHRKL